MSTQNRQSAKLDKILAQVEQYYTQKIVEYGATARGVDWNSPESQTLRFEQLLKVCDQTRPFSINDYGCGYGALADYMVEKGFVFEYRGFDISEQMIAKASELHRDLEHCQFFADVTRLTAADYTVASGIFNVKLETSDEEWGEYVLRTLRKIAELGVKGFAFNVLTMYSDREFMRPNLYYADPLFLFYYCKTSFSKYVALLHDYPLYEFTILVKK
jgi:SAM-dependent methyltransferase